MQGKAVQEERTGGQARIWRKTDRAGRRNMSWGQLDGHGPGHWEHSRHCEGFVLNLCAKKVTEGFCTRKWTNAIHIFKRSFWLLCGKQIMLGTSLVPRLLQMSYGLALEMAWAREVADETQWRGAGNPCGLKVIWSHWAGHWGHGQRNGGGEADKSLSRLLRLLSFCSLWIKLQGSLASNNVECFWKRLKKTESTQTTQIEFCR